MRDELKPYTAKEAADALGVDIKTIYAGIAKGDIDAFRINKVLRIPRPAFDAKLRGGDAKPISKTD